MSTALKRITAVEYLACERMSDLYRHVKFEAPPSDESKESGHEQLNVVSVFANGARVSV